MTTTSESANRVSRQDEWIAAVLAFAWFLLTLFGYNILRPLRETLVTDLNSEQKSFLFLLTFFVMLGVAPVYGYLATKLSRSWLLNVVVHFLAFNVLLFAVWAYFERAGSPEVQISNGVKQPALDPTTHEQILIASSAATPVSALTIELNEKTKASRTVPSIHVAEALVESPRDDASGTSLQLPSLSQVFFVWVSVFSLLVTSVFWSLLTDIFNNEQSKRLFGPISTGGTVGAITGAAAMWWFLAKLSMAVQFLIVFVLLEASLILAGALLIRVRRWDRVPLKSRATEGGVFAGLAEIAGSRYLMLIAVYLAMIAFCGTTNYMRLTSAVRMEMPLDAERTQFYATLNFWTQALTLIAQSLLVGPLMKRWGLAVTLMILPFIYLFSFGSLMLLEGALILGIVDVAVRTGAYGLTVPAREVLFTVVSRDAKYKSKNFIDTVVFRGFDAVASFARVGLPVVASLSIIWIAIGWILGRMQNSKVAQDSQSSTLES